MEVSPLPEFRIHVKKQLLAALLSFALLVSYCARCFTCRLT